MIKNGKTFGELLNEKTQERTGNPNAKFGDESDSIAKHATLKEYQAYMDDIFDRRC